MGWLGSLGLVSSRFVRRVRTASGAVAVQLVVKDHGEVVEIEHIGSAHSDAELALLLVAARERLQPGQQALDLGELAAEPARVSDIADWTRPDLDRPPAAPAPTPGPGRPRADRVGGRVIGTSALTLWNVLLDAYARLGFDALDDVAFRAMTLARVIEPTSKADTVRVLEEIGAPAPAVRTLFRALTRCAEEDYRGRLAKACLAQATRGGVLGLVLYDVTTLHFEAENEDALRKVGMSKERRVDPQIQVGLLVDPSGFPLEVHCFEGNTAETSTLLPVLEAFRERHQGADLVVVADAGMLSAKNLNAIEDAGLSFIVGSRISKAPYDLAAHFERHGNAFDDGQVLESARVMGTGKGARSRRVVYQYRFARHKRDDRAINAMVERAEKVAAGKRPLKKDRFVRIDTAGKEVDWGLVERARQLAGLKGYVTNLPVTTMNGAAVVAAYHDLWQVEKSFRMAKSDLRARPIFHHRRESIEAHLTVVFAALAVSRHLQDATGASIKNIVRTLRAVRSATIQINGHEITLDPDIPAPAQAILDQLPPTGH
jgi:Transposase DDE domain